MVAVINDPLLEQELIDQRRRTGGDRFDEVWEGIYMMAPLADNEHQRLAYQLCDVLEQTVGTSGEGNVFPGVNVSDRSEDWKKNYRCPDVVYYPKDTRAENRRTFWYGGPAFAIEIVSPGDRTREKLGFYAKVGTKELLVVDRAPWQLELYRLKGKTLVEVGRSTVERPEVLSSDAVPLTWQLVGAEGRPRVIVTHVDGQPQWTI